jgi:hypothetical protein
MKCLLVFLFVVGSLVALAWFVYPVLAKIYCTNQTTTSHAVEQPNEGAATPQELYEFCMEQWGVRSSD